MPLQVFRIQALRKGALWFARVAVALADCNCKHSVLAWRTN
jgi:hypothetical protein